MTITVSIGGIKGVLLRIWMFLVAAGLSVELWKYVFHLPKVKFVYFFGLSYEKNLPTWYVSCLLLVCALQLAFIASATRKAKLAYVWHWWVLAAGFLYISLDETATLHEYASLWFNLGGIFYFGWVIPAGILVVILGLCYLKFLAHLPRKTCWQFVAAGAIYVGGALGVELILGFWTDLAGSQNIVYGLIDLVEEAMEILGVTLFLVALADYITHSTDRLRISLESAEEPISQPVAARASGPVDFRDASSYPEGQLASQETSGSSEMPGSEAVVVGSHEA